jgi:hypothetical protein
MLEFAAHDGILNVYFPRAKVVEWNNLGDYLIIVRRKKFSS